MNSSTSNSTRGKLIDKFNLFPEPIYDTKAHTVFLGRLTTYLYVISMIVAFVIIITYYSTTERVQTKIEEKPSLETYLNLYNQYKSKLSCPCTQIAIPYKRFITASPSYHQYCSSFFNTKQMLDTIAAIDIYLYLSSISTLSSATTVFTALSDFCEISMQTVNDSLNEFYESNFVSGYTVEPAVFESQAQSFIDVFTSSTINSYKKSLDVLRTFLSNDQVLRGMYGTNFYATVNVTQLQQSTTVKFGFRTITSSNSTPCYCFMDSSCVTPAVIQGFNSQYFPVPGVFTGCSIMESVFISTLQAFYDPIFIANLSIPSNIPIVPLNVSGKSRYTPTTPIGTIISQLFVEDWNTIKSFEQYYSGCQPSSCSYIVQIRREPIEVLTAVLGIIGGLATVLKFVILYTVKGIDALIQKCRN